MMKLGELLIAHGATIPKQKRQEAFEWTPFKQALSLIKIISVKILKIPNEFDEQGN